MTDPDVLRIRHPTRIIRLIGTSLFLFGLLVPINFVLQVLQGGVLATIFAIVGLVTWVSSIALVFRLTCLRWEIVVDRRARTVTRRARLIRTIHAEDHPFEAFEAVELRRLGGTGQGTAELFAIVLVGPNSSLDIDDPGPVPSAAVFMLVARVSSTFAKAERLAIASTLVELMGLELRDDSGLASRPALAPVRPAPRVRLLDSGEQELKITRTPLGLRLAFAILALSSTGLLVLMALDSMAGDRLQVARNVVNLLLLSAVPLLVLVGLSYRSSLVIDFPSRLIRRRGSFLGSGWDDVVSLDQYERIVVREAKIPFPPGETRSVHLFGNRGELLLYPDRQIPRPLRTRGAGLDRRQRLLASAGLLADLCGLPLQVVKAEEATPPIGPGADPLAP